MAEILARANRGLIVENMYRGSVVMIGNEGRVKAYCGDSYQITYLRSAAKPLMATALVESGAADAFGFTPAELAITCGSHIGAPEHVAAVSGILQKLGLTEEALTLGPDLSLDVKLREQRIREQVKPRKIFHNCSGKHAGMLALCRHMGWDIDEYQAREHPVQQFLLQTVADFCGLPAADIIIGVDGCGVPVHGMPLYHMALGYYNLCNREQLAGARRKAAGRVLGAMTAEPQMVAGIGHFCTELMRVTKGRIIGKLGADGIYCAAEREGNWAVAVKIEDGNVGVIPAVIIRAFRQFDILSEEEHQALRHFAIREIKNCRGETVGMTKAAFHMDLA